MKIILKKSLQFTVIGTLCLVIVTLFATTGCYKWETRPKHTINFVVEEVNIKPQLIIHGNYATAPENPKREGYDFAGWFTDNGTFTNEWDFKTDIVMQDTTLYAKWEKYTLQETNLQGTKWKLTGIVDTNTSILTELDPKDCNECYTIVFDIDSTFSGQTVNNIIWGRYKIDYNTCTYRFTDCVISEAADMYDGELYSRLFFEIQFFTVKDTYPKILQLHYNEGKNYLKYKEIGG